MTTKDDHKEKHVGVPKPAHAEPKPAAGHSMGTRRVKRLAWMHAIDEIHLKRKLGVSLRSDKPAES